MILAETLEVGLLTVIIAINRAMKLENRISKFIPVRKVVSVQSVRQSVRDQHELVSSKWEGFDIMIIL